VCGRAAADGVELCNAGHCPPLLLQRQGVRKPDFAGLPLGLFASVEYPVAKIELAEHDTLVLYSDGVTEAQDPDGNQFGEERFTHSLRRHIEDDLEGVTQRVLQEVAAFRRGVRRSDDLTLLALRRRC
jgi:sigma-B regulation protein RsbU (phosphoserine phosphatase)